jgi:hypothetical protein
MWAFNNNERAKTGQTDIETIGYRRDTRPEFIYEQLFKRVA